MIYLLNLLLAFSFADSCLDALASSPKYLAAKAGYKTFLSVRSSLSKDQIVVLDAAEANLGKHEIIYREDRRGKELARHIKIQEAIASFNLREMKWSIFKIKRAIEERYGLKEYVTCQ